MCTSVMKSAFAASSKTQHNMVYSVVPIICNIRVQKERNVIAIFVCQMIINGYNNVPHETRPINCKFGDYLAKVAMAYVPLG